MTEDGEMAEERADDSAGRERGGGGEDVVADIDRFLGNIGDVEEIEARGEAASEPEDAEYEAAMNERYEDQIDHEKDLLRQGGIDVDGTGEGMPLGSKPMTGPQFRPQEVADAVARGRAERAAARGGGEAGVAVPDTGGVAAPAPAAGAADSAGSSGVPVVVVPGAAEPDGGASPEVGGAERPDGSPEPGQGEVIVVRLDDAGQALVEKFTEMQSAAVVEWSEAISKEVKALQEIVPSFAGRDVKELVAEVGKLEQYLRIEQADETRRREDSQGRRVWASWVAAVVVGVALFAAGGALQARWPVLDDGTNGWKDIVWHRHGIAIAECLSRVNDLTGGEVCSVTVQIR